MRGRRGITRFIPGGMKTVVVGLAALVVGGLVYEIRPSTTATARRNPFFNGANAPVPVGTAKAALGDVDINLNELGTVTPLATVSVRPQVGGYLVKLDFTEGQIVHAGEMLAQIDPRPYQATLDQAEGQLARDQAQLADAQLDLKRYQTLVAQNSIAQQQLDTQAALVGQLQGTIKADQANIESATVNLNYTDIKTPVTGRAGLRQVDLGNLLTAGQSTPVVVVTQMQPMSVVFTVPEDNIAQILARVRNGAKLKADAYDRAQVTKVATGTLATIDNEVDPTTGTVKLRAMFDNSKDELFPDQFVNIRLLVDTLHNQIVVPSAAIERGASGTFVYVVDTQAHQVSMHPVKLGQTDGDHVAIASGLNVGDTVVVDGADRLRDGARVVLPGEALPALGVANQQGGDQAGRRGGRRGGGGGRGGRGGGRGGQQQGAPQAGAPQAQAANGG
jgi:membrane fusion protein, multidrug efflux system